MSQDTLRERPPFLVVTCSHCGNAFAGPRPQAMTPEELAVTTRCYADVGPRDTPEDHLISRLCATIAAKDAEIARLQSHHDQAIAAYRADEKLIGELLPERDALKAEVHALKVERAALRDGGGALLDEVQEWCEAVERDSSWDGWDHHYKAMHYNGGMQKWRAFFAALTPKES